MKRKGSDAAADEKGRKMIPIHAALALTPDGFVFAPGPVLAETDRDQFAIRRIVDFYQSQPTDYADYFEAAWRYKHRVALGNPAATLSSAAG